MNRFVVRLLVLMMAGAVLVACGQTLGTHTSNMTEQPNPNDLRDPSVVIRKRERTLELYDGKEVIKTYPIALGFAPDGDKEREGDGKTPEGSFYIFGKNPKSQFHLSLGISYPSKDDAERGRAAGLITTAEANQISRAIDERKMPPQKTALGGEIYIHGGGTTKDWTWGCIALSNDDITEIYAMVRPGTLVTIFP